MHYTGAAVSSTWAFVCSFTLLTCQGEGLGKPRTQGQFSCSLKMAPTRDSSCAEPALQEGPEHQEPCDSGGGLCAAASRSSCSHGNLPQGTAGSAGHAAATGRCGHLHSSPVRTGGEARGLPTLRSWLLGFIVPLAFSASLNYSGIPTFTSSDTGSSSAHQSACGGRGISFPCSFRVSAAVLLPHTETKAQGVNGASKACWGLV